MKPVVLLLVWSGLVALGGLPADGRARVLDDLLWKADSLYYEGDYYGALEPVREALERDRENAAVWSFLGRVLFKIARFEEARESFDQALAIDPWNFWAHYGLGLYHLARGEPAQAMADLASAHEAEPAHELPCLMLSRAADELDRHREALEWIETAIGLLEAEGRTVPASLRSERDLLALLAERYPYRVSPGFEDTTVPLEGGRPVVGVSLGTGGEGLFLLDTAASRALIAHPRVVRRAFGDYVASLEGGSASGKADFLILLHRIEIGTMAIEDVPCLVTERVMLAGVDGMIGLPILRRFGWSFDFQEGTVTVRDPALGPDRAHRYARNPVVTRLYPGGPLMVPVVLEGERPAVVVLDSGSDAVSLDHEFFEQELEAWIPLGRQTRIGYTESPHGAKPLVAFELSSIALGGTVVLRDVPVRTYALEGPKRWAGVSTPGVMGLGLLSDWRVDLDFYEQRLTLSPAE